MARPLRPLALLTLAAFPLAAQGVAGIGLRSAEPEAFPGVTLVAPLGSADVFLVDLAGQVVHTWHTALPPSSAYLLPDGHLLRCARVEPNPWFHGGGICGAIQEFDWDGNLVWDYRVANERETEHHDLEPLPNGDVLFLAWERKTRDEAIAAGRAPDALGPDGLWPLVVKEVRPVPPDGGVIVWEWHAWDHLVQERDPALASYGKIAAHPELLDVNAGGAGSAPPGLAPPPRARRPPTPQEQDEERRVAEQMRALGYAGGGPPPDGPGAPGAPGRPPRPDPGHDADWLHTNAVDWLPGEDLILLSSAHLGEIFVIDHATTSAEAAGHVGGRRGKGGDLLWRWGNPRNYGTGSAADQRLFYQHDPEWIAGTRPGELRVLVFDNGRGRPEGEFSSVEEFVLPFDPERGFVREEGEPFGPAESAWSYSDPGAFFSSFISGAQRLPNGDTLICEGATGRVFEVNRSGETVWEWCNPFCGVAGSGGINGAALFRATRIAADDPALAGRDLTPGR